MNIIESIGRTPLVELQKCGKDLSAKLFLKSEFFNPLASVKDRIGAAMIEAAEQDGSLRPDSVVIEPTSGNTGIAFCFSSVRPKDISAFLQCRKQCPKKDDPSDVYWELKLYSPHGPKGMGGAIARANQLLEEHGDKGFMPQQFNNPANPAIHRKTTAEEIWSGLEGKVDCLVAGVGTGDDYRRF